MSRLSAAWGDRTVRIILLTVAALFVVGLALRLAGVTSGDSSSDEKTARYGLTQPECRAFFDQRIGHNPNDNAFWAALIDCANSGLLPAGQNNPGYYAP